MINKLHLAMIELYRGDAKRIQHFCKVHSYAKLIAERLLKKLGFDQEISDRVQYLIAHHHTYNNINEIDYQILVEADFLVNIMEDGLTKEAALKAYHSIFKTACGKMICREMFDI